MTYELGKAFPLFTGHVSRLHYVTGFPHTACVCPSRFSPRNPLFMSANVPFQVRVKGDEWVAAAAGGAGAGGAGVAAADFIASVSISSLITFRIIPRSLRSCHGVARGEVVSGQ